MNALNCPNCGAALPARAVKASDLVTCEFCGTTFRIPKTLTPEPDMGDLMLGADFGDKHLPGWCHEPELLVRADCCIADAEIWNAHADAKQALIDRVERQCSVTLHPKVPILGFARRMTAYKRPELLFTDLARLRGIAGQWPFQVVLAGKALSKLDSQADRRSIEPDHHCQAQCA